MSREPISTILSTRRLQGRIPRGTGVANLSPRRSSMTDRNDHLPHDVERAQFDAYSGQGDEHGEPREYRYGSDFDKQEPGRWARQDRENVFSRPYDEWSNPG